MTELFATKAVVKLPKKTNTNRLSHHLMWDTSSDYNNMATHATASTKLQQQVSPLSEEYYSSFLVTEKLYIDGLPNSVIETEIMDLVKSCCPERICLSRNHEYASGYIQFKSKEMADRAYTLLNGVTFRAGLRLQLKINPPSSNCPEPEAHAGILHIKNLPGHTNNKLLYELFRPFGPMILCKILVEQASTFKGTALVQYFNSQDAQDAESMMDNKTVQGNTISVFPIIPNSSKPTRSSVHSIETKDTTLDNANTVHISTPTSPLPPTPAPMNNTASSPTSVIRSDGSSMVDYTNLYIKNLDLNVKSVDLFNSFRRFGRIISARVMKNAQTKQSKGFGFVSFSKADEAQKAKHEMNGEFILSKPVIVAFHEPKKAREADVSVSPTQSTFNGASRQQMAATAVSPHLVQHQQQQQQYNRLSPPPPPTPSFTSSPSNQNMYEQQQKQQQSNGSGYYTNNNNNKINNKNTTRTRDSIDQRYGSNLTMPQQKYNNNSSSYQQAYPPSHQPLPAPPPSNGMKISYQPMERNNSNLSHHQHHQSSMGASNQYDQRQQQQQTIQYQGLSKKVYEPYQGQQQQQHTYNTPIKRIPSATGSVQQPPSLSTLASGALINTPQHTNATTPTSVSINNTYQHLEYYQQQQQQHISPPPPQYHNLNNHWSYSPHSQKQQQQQQQNERPTFRRRGSVESMASVMTETSSQTRKQTITKAVLAVEKGNDSNLNDIVDMLLTLRKKDLATCLFNKVFLKAKIKQAKDALDIFVEEQQQQQQEASHQNLGFHESTIHMSSPPPASTMVANYYYQPKEEPTPSYIQHVALPPKGSRAIPIVAPPPAPTTMPSTPSPAAVANSSKTGIAHNAKTANATNGASAATPATAAPLASASNKPSASTDSKLLDSNTMNAQELSEEISKFLKTLDGLPLHEKKQSLGDRLFPLVKSTGVKQAPKITIRLLDSVPLDELAYSMYDKDKLKQQVSQISATISTKY